LAEIDPIRALRIFEDEHLCAMFRPPGEWAVFKHLLGPIAVGQDLPSAIINWAIEFAEWENSGRPSLSKPSITPPHRPLPTLEDLL